MIFGHFLPWALFFFFSILSSECSSKDVRCQDCVNCDAPCGQLAIHKELAGLRKQLKKDISDCKNLRLFWHCIHRRIRTDVQQFNCTSCHMFMIYLFIFATWPENEQVFLHPSFCFWACLLLSPATLLTLTLWFRAIPQQLLAKFARKQLFWPSSWDFPHYQYHQNVGF